MRKDFLFNYVHFKNINESLDNNLKLAPYHSFHIVDWGALTFEAFGKGFCELGRVFAVVAFGDEVAAQTAYVLGGIEFGWVGNSIADNGDSETAQTV